LTDITVEAQPNGASLPLVIAEGQGFFKDVGLNATIKYYSTGPATLAAGAAGQWDAGWIGAPPTLTGMNSFGLIPVGLMIIEDSNHIMFMTKKVLEGSTPAEVLKTHPVATAQNTLAQQVMFGCAKHFGVDPKSVKLINLDPGGIVQALKTGKVDVIDSWATPDYSLLNDSKYVQVCNGAKAGVSVVDPYVVTQKFADSNPDAAAAYISAVYRANEYINTHPAEAVKYMMDLYKANGIAGDEAQAKYEIDIRKWLTYDEALTSMKNGKTAAALKASADFFVSVGVYPKAPPVDELLAKGLPILEAAGSVKSK
jgi:ABC-type nitrate/sulfonate/bicarbonate transport system substrate-binding protein